MSEQSGNEEHLKQNDVPVTKLNSPPRQQENADNETANSSTSKAESKTYEALPTEKITPDTGSSDEMDQNQMKISTDETLNQMEIINTNNINDKIETAKQKTFKLPRESEDAAPSSVPEVVGDDFSKKSEVRILCECEPNVAGAAVPTVKSFTPTENQNSLTRCNKSDCNLSGNDLKENDSCAGRSLKYGPVPFKKKEPAKLVSKIGPKLKDSEKEKICASTVNKKFKCSQQINQCFKPIVEKSSSEMKLHPKKPSLIPKPTRPTSSNCKNFDKDDTEKRPNVPQQSNLKWATQKNISKSTNCKPIVKETKVTHLSADIPKNTNVTFENHVEDSDAASNANTISSRMMGLQERLKATTSMLRQKIEMDKSKEITLSEDGSVDLIVEEEANQDVVSSKRVIDDLYKSISNLKDAATALSDNSTLKGQTRYIEKLFRNISEIKSIADKLCTPNQSKSIQEIPDDANSSNLTEKEKSPKSSATSAKDNKIYIKFMHAKDRKSDNKKKNKDVSSDQSEEVQTDLALGSKLTSDSLSSDTCVTEKNQEENKIKEADSMDGVFIPSCEPPINMEDEEETNGLDITITFPEFSHLYSNGIESHLSVCLSDISAEALKKLKRCPKDFTLRMDFVEGKVLFQSGKWPANNFQIGPDLKFAENIVDTKTSDIISIKPSTECSFGSQLIPVETAKENKSCRSLKSTDSELFNVVSLPFLYKNPYLATSHKSCITFRNDQIMSMAVLAKHIYKSMPQIPSLTNIFEDKIMENSSKTDARKKAQKPPEPKGLD